MTMLDRMRRHKGWLKWSLALVCLTFVLFYIPDFLRSGSPAAPGSQLAAVNGRGVTVGDYQRRYQAQLAAYRSAYGGNISEQLLRQLGIQQQILQQLVDEQAALAEAERLGITVSDEELARQIVAIPAFQENGQFIGEQRYDQVLRMQRPPLTKPEFEQNLRQSLVLDKLRAAITGWLTVVDRDVEQEYRRRNEKVRLDVVALTADKFRDKVVVTDTDVAGHFNERKVDYRIPEKRKIRFVLVELDANRAKASIPPAGVQRYYDQNIEQFSTPEQVRASHVLLKTEGKIDAEVKARAEDVLKQAKAGADFAELAKQFSEDESNAKNGGDLDYFGRGRMVPEFDLVVFAMQPGQISDLVKTQFGYHVILLTDKKPATTRSLDEVRPQIVDQLAFERAQAQVQQAATQLAAEIKTPADLDTAARKRGLKVQESGFFTREEPIASVGMAPEVNETAFRLKPGEVSEGVRAPRGVVFLTVAGKQDSRQATLDEVKDRVREDVIRKRAAELSQARATEIAASLKAAKDFAAAAKAAGVEVKTTEDIAREAPIADLGASPEVDKVAFSLPVGSVSDPIPTPNGTAIIRVIDRKEAPAGDVQAKASLREQMLTERRGRFFADYMMKAKQKMKIDINRETLQQLTAQAS